MTDEPFDYKYPVLSFPGCYQAGGGPEIDYKFYQDSDYIKVAELIEMLLDPYCADNEDIKGDKPDEWKELYNSLWELISRGLKSGKLKAINYSPGTKTNQKVNFWTIELIPSSIGNWIIEKNIIKKIESVDIKVSGKFKELIQSHTSNQKLSPLPSNSLLPIESGTPWSDITITLLDKDTVEVSVKDKKEPFKYSQLGFLNKTTKNTPKKAWWILVLFIKEKGFISSKSDHDFSGLMDDIKGFKALMKRGFGIDEELIPHYKSTSDDKKTKGWKVKFKTIDKTQVDFKTILGNGIQSKE